jgi:hypothetical protein
MERNWLISHKPLRPDSLGHQTWWEWSRTYWDYMGRTSEMGADRGWGQAAYLLSHVSPTLRQSGVTASKSIRALSLPISSASKSFTQFLPFLQTGSTNSNARPPLPPRPHLLTSNSKSARLRMNNELHMQIENCKWNSRAFRTWKFSQAKETSLLQLRQTSPTL